MTINSYLRNPLLFGLLLACSSPQQLGSGDEPNAASGGKRSASGGSASRDTGVNTNAGTGDGGTGDGGATNVTADGGVVGVGGVPNSTVNHQIGGTAGLGSTGGATHAGGIAGVGAGGVPPIVTCTPPKEVSTAEEVVAAVVALGSDWSTTTLRLDKVDAITDDLVATVDIAVQAALVPPPTSTCAKLSMGVEACSVRFYGPGDSVLSGSDTLQLPAGTAIRLRPYIMDLHPVSGFSALIKVMPPCSTPCRDDAWRCPNDRVCYAKGEAYCLNCEKRAAEICACERPPEPESSVASTGTCYVYTSNDHAFVGTCQNGICELL